MHLSIRQGRAGICRTLSGVIVTPCRKNNTWKDFIPP